MVALAMADILNFTTTKIVDKRPGRSGVEYKYEFGPLWLATRCGHGTNGTCSYPGLRERTGTGETSRDIEEEKREFSQM
jgi:hypothetical protein